MPSVPDPVKKGASVAATVLEGAAGVLRVVAGDEEPAERVEPSPAAEAKAKAKSAAPPAATVTPTPAAAPPAPKPVAPRGAKPAAGTRSRIANPKAAKKVRAREG